jgi:hypothetical protein
MMTVDQLKEADGYLTYISRDLGSADMPKPVSGESQSWEQYSRRANSMAAIARAILGEAMNPAECVISLQKLEEPPNPLDEWRTLARWRHLVLTGPGGGAAKTDLMNDEKLGSPPLDQKLTFQLAEYVTEASAKRSNYGPDDWGAIALLHKFKNPQKLDATTWAVARPLRPEDGPGAIRLKLNFRIKDPFPPLEDWPEK